MHPAEARIDLAALRANAALAGRLAGTRELIGVVKADAYGHGAVAVAETLVAAGVGRLAVLTVPEAVVLREASIAVPLLVLAGARNRAEADTALARRLTTVVHHTQSLDRIVHAARAAGARATVHVEVDTGMHRMGVPREEAPAFLREVADRAELELEGVFTHFARADEADLAPSLEQARRFREVLSRARALGVSPRLVHADNSPALMAGPALAAALPEATAVRPGLMLYGARPAPHLPGALLPVMTLVATVLAIRDVPAGETVGYGGTFAAPAGGTRVATLSVGYEDGVPREAGNRGEVWLGGRRRPIVGRVSMDSITVEIAPDEPQEEVAVGAEAVIFGGDGAGAGVPVEEAAEAARTLAYELLVRVGSRVPRTLVDVLVGEAG